MLTLLLLLACRDDAPAPRLPNLPTAGCGSAAYDWLPPDTLGAVVLGSRGFLVVAPDDLE